MKVQCDVCKAETASVFCCADEAALCDTCDRRVHSANKLAGKHGRLSLLHANSNSSDAPPLCDICQEKRGFLFCQEDRAILCKGCDVSIHNANQLTAKHSRFLLTGIKLSASPIPAEEAETITDTSSNNSHDNSSSTIDQEKVMAKMEEEVLCTISNTNNNTNSNSSSSSSISEYLINTLPGWHVEDFLFDATTANSIATPNSFYDQMDEALSFTESSDGFAEALPLWSHFSGTPESSDYEIFGNGANEKKTQSGGKGNRKQRSEDAFMVPEFQNDRNNKRLRTSALW